MNSGGQPNANGSDPYQGINRAMPSSLTNVPTSDKVFGSTMPSVQPTGNTGINSSQIYGNQSYINPNLQGYSQSGQNIVNIDQLSNQVTPVTPQAVEQMQRQNIQQQPAANQPAMPVNPNQMYMQPPVVPQISQMQSAIGQPIPQPGQVGQPLPYHDLTTAEGSIDYLNAIAPKGTKQKTGLLSNKMFVILGASAIALVLVLSVVGALGNSGGSFNKKAHALGTAIANLQSVVEYGQTNSSYTSSDLSSVTAETSLIMLSHQKTLGGLMTLAIDDKGKATDATPDGEIETKLDSAKATGSLNSAYRNELRNELTAVADATREAYNATKKSDIRQALETTYNDLTELTLRLSRASAPNSGDSAN